MYFKWIRLNYLYLIIAGILGLFMRMDTGVLLEIPYKNLLHTHSHIAFLGWVYPTLFIFLINGFLGKQQSYKFKWQLIITHILIAAMLVAFLWQGYGFFSIIFSSLFQLLNYWFIFSYLNALKKEKTLHPVPGIFIKIALGSLFLSTFGPWALGILVASGAGKGDLYNMAIYFYLHFQYNGWMIFALFALFFRQIISEQTKGIRYAVLFLTFMAFALVPGYFISLLNIFKDAAWNFSLAALSTFLQLQALYFFMRFFITNKAYMQYKKWPLKVLFGIVSMAFILKLVLQFLSVIPFLSTLAFNNHNIIISFLHLVMLGIVTGYLIILLWQNGIIPFNLWMAKSGLILFLTGFIFLELILGFQFTGFIIYAYKNLTIISTAVLLTGLIIMFPVSKKERDNVS